MSNVKHFEAVDTFSLVSILDNIAIYLENGIINDQSKFYQKLQLIIIDSMVVISPLLTGVKWVGHTIMMNISRTLKHLAFKYNIAILVILFLSSAYISGYKLCSSW
jgi:hypothetical protein